MRFAGYLMACIFPLLSSCAVAGGIFKAGMYWGIFWVIALIVLILYLITRVRKK